ncbi:MAG: dethiobiotin synthase [Acidimicrobiia bacterium]
MIRFVTGTCSGVGKTVATAVLARRDIESGKRVAYLKPVETGAGPEDIGDAAFIADAVGIPTHEALRFSARLDPALAAEQSAVSIGLDWLVDLARTHSSAVDVLYVEGNGGLFSALSGEHTTGELAQRLGADLVVVTRTGPGILNEVGLTVEVAKNRQLYVAGLVVNHFPANPGAIEDAILARLRRTAPVLGLIAETEGLDTTVAPAEQFGLDFIPDD